MNRFERIQAALNSQEVDRVPVNLWMHFSEADQDPRTLAETQVAFAEKYNFDFIKLMPFGLYGVQDYGAKIKIFSTLGQPPLIDDYGIQTANEWQDLPVLPAYYGTLGKQVQLAQHVEKLSKGRYPFIQTIFSPLTNARKLAGERLLQDIRNNPQQVKQGLQAITETTINFVKANIDSGVSGFFFATQCANTDYLSVEEYQEFGAYYDLQVINAFKDETFFNVAHLHGDNGMFDLIKDYPVNCINWHDRWSSPTLADARRKTGKCLMGGVREVPYFDNSGNLIRDSILVDGSAAEIRSHVFQALDQVAGRGLIIGPGCVVDQRAREENILAVKAAADHYLQRETV